MLNIDVEPLDPTTLFVTHFVLENILF